MVNSGERQRSCPISYSPDFLLCAVSLEQNTLLLSDNRDASRLGFKQEEGYVWQGSQNHAYGKATCNLGTDHWFEGGSATSRAARTLDHTGGMYNGTISDTIGLQRKQVGLWRRRWKQSFDALVAIECRESQAALRRAIEDVLSDAPRSGSPGKFTAEEVTQVLAIACEPVDKSNRPVTQGDCAILGNLV